ncbi:MAG TPA: PAS domain S-box protein [Myxococcales bacterium]|nr:PAS domain S-box protein [Myxococcales bacterium]
MRQASHSDPNGEVRATPGLDFYRLVEHASDLILIVQKGRIIYANPAFARTLGYAPEELVGRPPAVIVHPEERENSRSRVEQALREGSAKHIERRLVRKDGSIVTIDGSAFSTTFESGPVVVLMGHDLTDRKRAEEESRRSQADFRALVEAIPGPVAVHAEGRFLYLNAAAATVLGYSPDELLGRSVFEVIPEHHHDEARRRLAKPHPPEGMIERDFLHKDGTSRILTIAEISTTFEGRPARLTVGFDSTNRVKAEQALAASNAALRRSEAMSAIGSLVAGVAHEVRNPLFGMTATLDALGSRLGPVPEAEPFMQMLRHELERLNTLMRDLLDYGRPPAAQLTLEPLAPVIEAAVRACAARAEQRNVRIDNAVAEEAGELRMDGARIGQVFQNLVENAVQHAPAGSRVRIEASSSQLGVAPSVEVRVLDSGRGFRPDDLPRVFDPFFTRRRGGTGLGLSIVQRITEQHGGSVEAGNRPGGGAVLTVRLPRDPAVTLAAG